MRAPSAVLLMLLLLLVLPPGPAGGARGEPGLEAPVLVEPRGPIRIDGDADLDAAHGVRGGSGEPGDPYLISSWRIQAERVHVRIANTTKAIMVRNLDLEGTCRQPAPENANCTLEAGIFVTNAQGPVSLVRNRIAGMARGGINVNASRGAQIVDNSIEGGGSVPWAFSPPGQPPSPPGGAGILVQASDGAQVRGNLVVAVGHPSGTASTPGIIVMASNRTVVSHNVVTLAREFALVFVAVRGALAEDNILHDNGNGTAFLGFEGLFRYNNVTGNHRLGVLVAAADGWMRAEHNVIAANGGGFEVAAPSNATLRQNLFADNRDFGLRVHGDAFADALENWWQSADGPNVTGQGPGQGQVIQLALGRRPQLVYEPWLAARPAQVGANAQRAGAGVVTVAASTGPAPTAVLEGPRVVAVGTEATFSAARSSDPEGGPLQVRWDFGAAGTDEGLLVSRTFDATGEVVVTLRVTDQQGLTSTAQVVVQVVRLPLGVELTAQPTQVPRGQNVTLTAASYGQPNGTVAFRFTARGPGTFEGPGGPANETRVAFDEPGVHFVGVEARAGGEVATAFERVVVVNRAPTAVASAEPRQGAAGTPFRFSAAGSSDPDGDPLSYHWEFGGAASADGAEVERTFQDLGTHVARLTVSDGLGSDSEEIRVEVTAAPPAPEEPRGAPALAPALAALAAAFAARRARRWRGR